MAVTAARPPLPYCWVEIKAPRFAGLEPSRIAGEEREAAAGCRVQTQEHLAFERIELQDSPPPRHRTSRLATAQITAEDGNPTEGAGENSPFDGPEQKFSKRTQANRTGPSETRGPRRPTGGVAQPTAGARPCLGSYPIPGRATQPHSATPAQRRGRRKVPCGVCAASVDRAAGEKRAGRPITANEPHVF